MGQDVIMQQSRDFSLHGAVELRAALQVQSIPMVVAVVGGQVLDGFLGALPEAQVRDWVSHVMAAAQQLGLAGGAGAGSAGGADGPQGSAVPGGQEGPGAARPYPPGAGPMGPGGPGPDPMADPAFGEAQQAMERGDLDGAAGAFEKVLAATPGHPIATLGLAQVDLIRRVNSYDQAKARRDAAENPDDVDAQCRVADIDLATGRSVPSGERPEMIATGPGCTWSACSTCSRPGIPGWRRRGRSCPACCSEPPPLPPPAPAGRPGSAAG